MTNLIVYQPENSNNSIELPIDVEHRTVWATQRQISETLNLDVRTVSHHIQNFKEQRGDKAGKGIQKFRIPTSGGYQDVEHYDMTVITYIGFRAQATERVIAFQDWVGEQLDKAITQQSSLTPTQALLKAVEQMVIVEQEVQELKRQNASLQQLQAEQAIGLEATNERITQSEYFTIRQWCNAQRINVTESVRQKWGREASALSRARQIEIIRVNEGAQNVGSYHKSILMEVCVVKPKTDPDQLKLGA